MRIRLNGEPNEAPDGVTISNLLAGLGISEDRVAVEVNMDIIKKKFYKTHVLHEGDEVEVVNFVGGGSV